MMVPGKLGLSETKVNVLVGRTLVVGFLGGATSDTLTFPGTIIAGVFQEYKSDEAGMDLHVFFKPTHQSIAPAYTTTAVQEFTYYITLYGLPPSQKLNLVEIPGDTLPYTWAPEIVGLASPSITEKTNYRLLSDGISHQWWGVSVSRATKDD